MSLDPIAIRCCLKMSPARPARHGGQRLSRDKVGYKNKNIMRQRQNYRLRKVSIHLEYNIKSRVTVELERKVLGCTIATKNFLFFPHQKPFKQIQFFFRNQQPHI